MAKSPASSSNSAESPDAPKFEEALARLEAIVHALEDGDVGLDDSLRHYEEGIGLLRQAYGLLEKAQRRIEILSGVDSQGNPITRPLADVASIDADG
jgi:exodeoxyribonuclease VII small subunit